MKHIMRIKKKEVFYFISGVKKYYFDILRR